MKKYRFVFLNGEEIRVNVSEFLALIVHKELFVFYVGAYLFNYLFNVYDFLSGFGSILFGLILMAIITLTVISFAAFNLIYIFMLPKDSFGHKIYITIPLAAANTFTSILVCLIAKFFWVIEINLDCILEKINILLDKYFCKELY